MISSVLLRSNTESPLPSQLLAGPLRWGRNPVQNTATRWWKWSGAHARAQQGKGKRQLTRVHAAWAFLPAHRFPMTLFSPVLSHTPLFSPSHSYQAGPAVPPHCNHRDVAWVLCGSRGLRLELAPGSIDLAGLHLLLAKSLLPCTASS